MYEFNTMNLFRRFIDDRWPARLSPTQAMVWLAMLKHANKTSGEAWPSAAKIASYLGHRSVVRIHAAKTALVRAGLLTVISLGGGAHRTTRFRVQLPDTVSKSGTVAESGTVADSESLPLPNPAETIADSDSLPLPKAEPKEVKKKSDKNPDKGERPPDLDSLFAALPDWPARVREKFAAWIARRPGRQLSHDQAADNFGRFSRLSPDDAYDAISRAIDCNHQTIYTDRIGKPTYAKPNRDDRTRDEHPEPSELRAKLLARR